MLRNMIKRGIRAAQDDSNRGRNSPPNGKAIPTFAHDRVVSGIPPAETPEEDKRRLREIGRRVVTEAVRSGFHNA